MTPGYITGRLAAVTVCLAAALLQSAFAQGTGTVSGTVVDRTTKDRLPGAHVVIKGTSLGAATSLDGVFIIKNVPAGRQTLTVSYVGYVTAQVPVTVPEKQSVTQDISLTPTTLEGEEIVVTAQGQGQLQAINQQLASDKIVNVVSEAKIQELPDFNAAQAISRLPGVSTLQSSGEANKVVIRGLAPQYNAVEVEGTRLASTGSTQIGASSLENTAGQISVDRSVDLSMVTPYMLKSISVYKTLTPDLNANAIGGTVNMGLREAPSGFHGDVLWQSGYTAKSNTYGNYRAILSGSNRFFEELLGVYVLLNAESYDRNADNMNASYVIAQHRIGENGYEPVQVSSVALNRHVETRNRYGGNLILDYALESGYLKSVNMFTRLESDYDDYRTVLDYRNKNLNFTYRGGENTVDLAVNTLEFDYDFGPLLMNLKFSNTYSFNDLPKSPYLEFSQTGGIVGAIPQNTIPDSLTYLVSYLGDTLTYLRNVNIFSTQYKENNQALRGDFKVPFSLGGSVSGYLKVGGVFQYDHHTNNQETPYVQLNRSGNFQQAMMDTLVALFGVPIAPNGYFAASNFTNLDGDLYETFLENRFGTFYWAADPTVIVQMADYLAGNPQFSGRATGTETGGYFNGPYQQLPNDYDYVNRYFAAYLMTELAFLDFTVVGGVRYEKERSDFSAINMTDARNPLNQPYYPITVYPENEFWLPMVQVKYDAAEWMDVRYAYTQTIARPDYHQLSPHANMNYNLTNVWAGNPNLKPAHAFNHDVILTFHTNELGLFSIGAFYKTIEEFTYYTQYDLHATAPPGLDSLGSFTPRPQEGATLYTYVNSENPAYVKGIEIDFQTRLWYVMAPFNGIVLGVNYSHIISEAVYPWRDNITLPNPNPPPRNLVTVKDSARDGRLIHQPKDILNAYIGYDYEGFSIRVSFLFQGNAVSYVGAFPEQDGFTRDYFRVDGSVRQRLPWAGLELFADLANLNSRTNISAQKSIGGFTNEQNYGLTASLGVRYRF